MVQTLILLWLAGILLRIWRLARFFQIEGYQNTRYLRWLVARVPRYVMWRALIFIGVASLVTLALKLTGQNTEAVYMAIWGLAGLMSIWPEPAKEVKQAFKLTQRAMRLLITAFALGVIALIGTQVVLEKQLTMTDTTKFAVITGIGLLVYHLSPLALPLANLFNFPIEEGFRLMFRERARRALHKANPVVIGVTGSYGKTSTKEYLAHILGGKHRVLATPKSYNTLMGVCLVINNHLRNDPNYDYFIVEMGAYVEGEIRAICKLVRPQIGIITAVGPQHLERFGSIEATTRAKYELIEALPPDGVGIFNWDNCYVRAMYERGYPATRIGVTWQNAEHVKLRFLAHNITGSLSGIEFDVEDTLLGEKQHFKTSLLGQHTVTNILLAAAVARHLGITLTEIAMRVASLESAEHRLQRKTLPNNITVIDDAYSANPIGARNALDVLALYQNGRRVLITPGIVELGPLQEQENTKLGRYAAQVCTDIVLVGIEQTRPLQQGIRETGFNAGRLHILDTREEAIAWFHRELKAGDTVLFLNDLPDTYL
ncbi:MAG: UDP-N-acetylmuramoyl-tripeptide--D-alanyl-D-alanine ligase [Anaerolineae bacterium]|nr:UDP-N-acetylmuramoyl-tripeptide--D-alanyl-D-alanine ligase [Anaerolineae bacterium]